MIRFQGGVLGEEAWEESAVLRNSEAPSSPTSRLQPMARRPPVLLYRGGGRPDRAALRCGGSRPSPLPLLRVNQNGEAGGASSPPGSGFVSRRGSAAARGSGAAGARGSPNGRQGPGARPGLTSLDRMLPLEMMSGCWSA